MKVQKQLAVGPTFWDRELRCRIQVAGRCDCTVHGDSVSFVIAMASEAVAAALNAGLLDDPEFVSIDIELSYWHLTDDLKKVEITAGLTGIPRKGQSAEACLNHHVALVKADFLKSLALAQIALVGSAGKLKEIE